jgi:hypothetical protein
MEQGEEASPAEVDAELQQLPPDAESPEEDDSEPTHDGLKAKRIRPSPKATWILTYGASGPYITPQMLLDLEEIKADEYHSTKDRVMNFTYIHLTQRVRQSSIERFMAKANEAHGIVKNEIFGYDSIASSSRQKNDNPIEEHAGFQMLVRHFNSRNPAFQPCTDSEPILKRGRILKAAEVDHSRPSTLGCKTRTQLIAYAESLEQRLKEADEQGHEILAQYNALSSERSSIREENALLKRKIQDLENGRV